MAWQRGKVEGRKSSRVMSKSKHLHPHSGSSRTCSSVKKKKKIIYLFLALVRLHCYTGLFSICNEWGLLSH